MKTLADHILDIVQNSVAAKATLIEIVVEEYKTDDYCNITITDNGKGFELPDNVGDLAKNGKLGLTGMQERAQLIGGTLSVKSKPYEGTSITVELPG